MEEKEIFTSFTQSFSEIAIYDPTLTLTVPADLTIQTALDTLSHALESIWNKNKPFTIPYAIKSAQLIMNHLENLTSDLTNLTLRDHIMKACMFAGSLFKYSNRSCTVSIYCS